MNLSEIGSVPLRMVAKTMRKQGKLAHTAESVACVAKAASCNGDIAMLHGYISGRQIAVLDSAAYISVIEESIRSGKATRDYVDGIAKWATTKGTEAAPIGEVMPNAAPAKCECGHEWSLHSKVADTGCLARSDGVYCQCKRAMPEAAECAPVSSAEVKAEEVEIEAEIVATVPAVAKPAPGSIDAMIDARIDTRLDGFKPMSTLNKDDVRQIVDEIARETAQTITIKIERKDGTKTECKDEHFMFERLVRLMGAGIHVYLWGPAGTGKTTAALHAAHAIGKESEIDTLDPSTPKSGVLGYRTPTGEPAETAFTRMYRAGGVYIPDECDNGPAHVQSLLNSALANGHAPCAWGQVPRGDGFVLAGTGNTPGRPTPSFPDRRPMSAAFADRLYFMYWPLDPGIECRAAGLPVPRYPVRKEATCTASAWVTWVRGIREWAERNAPTLMITPRASLLGMQALACGETPEEVAHGLVFRGADKTLVEKALNACSLPG